MDIDDDDAFLYGAAAPAAETKLTASSAPISQVKPSVSASMAASLAAYGIDPAAAVAAENPEDGGVEEEDPEDEDDSDSDDEVDLVFNAQAQRLDLRKPQATPTNVIGIGRWAHTSTGTAAPAVASPAVAPSTPRVVAPTANQTTEYTPTSRPGQTPSSATIPNSNPPIPPSGDGSTTPNIQPQPTDQSLLSSSSNVQNLNGLPPSNLPPVQSNGYKIDPENPSGIIPSTGNSVYDIDLAQFEGSGQPWRRPGSDIQDWFNFGFDEVSYPRFLRYRQEMEIGRNAMMNLPMGGMTPEVAQLLHLPNPMMAMNQMNQMANMGNMGNMGNMNQMGNMGNMNMAQMAQMGFNPQQMQQAMQMGGFGMGMEGMNQQGQGQGQQGQGQGQNQQQRNTPQRAVTENGEEVKQEEGGENGQGPAMRGGPAARGGAVRGRGGAIPSGPRAGVVPPGNIPKGPKAGRFKDKDRVENSTSDLNYGDDESSSYPAASAPGGGSRSSSPTKSERRDADRSRSRRYRDRSYDDGYDSRDSRNSRTKSNKSPSPRKDRERSGRRSRRDREKDDEYDEEYDYDSRDRDRGDRGERRRERDGSARAKERDGAEGGRRDKRKREESGGALGPGGWESDEEEVRPRRRRSPESEEEDRYSRRSKRR